MCVSGWELRKCVTVSFWGLVHEITCVWTVSFFTPHSSARCVCVLCVCVFTSEGGRLVHITNRGPCVCVSVCVSVCLCVCLCVCSQKLGFHDTKFSETDSGFGKPGDSTTPSILKLLPCEPSACPQKLGFSIHFKLSKHEQYLKTTISISKRHYGF